MGVTPVVLVVLTAVLACSLVPTPALAAQVETRRADPDSDTTTDEVVPPTPLAPLLARGYKKMAQTILPLLVGFKATGLLTAAIAITKLILLKAVFLSTTALFVAGLLALKKFLSLGHPHDMGGAYTYQHHDLSHVPYLQAAHTASADFIEPQVHVPQVTYIGGSYGLQSIPYSASAGLGGAAGSTEDIQGLYSAQNSVATLSAAQLQQLQQQQALLAQQLGNTTQQQQALQLSRRRLNAPQGASAFSPYPYRPSRPEARQD